MSSTTTDNAFAEEQARLAAAGVPASVVGAGMALPDATLLDPHGAPVGLHAILGERATVMVFYRGAWCPHCKPGAAAL